MAKFTRTNEKIRAPQLRVIDEDGNQIGVLTRDEALTRARNAELDLVEISPDAKPPVAKIIDWGKFNYQKTKQLKKNKQSSKSLDVKQTRMGLKISDHDLETKAKRSLKFLIAGHKVKYVLRYRGRELAHRDIGYQLADKIIESFVGEAIVDQKPQFAGRQLSFTIRRDPAAAVQDKKNENSEATEDNKKD